MVWIRLFPILNFPSNSAAAVGSAHGLLLQSLSLISVATWPKKLFECVETNIDTNKAPGFSCFAFKSKISRKGFEMDLCVLLLQHHKWYIQLFLRTMCTPYGPLIQKEASTFNSPFINPIFCKCVSINKMYHLTHWSYQKISTPV